MKLKNRIIGSLDKYLLLTFIIGVLPAFFIIHVFPRDFGSYYLQALSILKFKGIAYQIMPAQCNNPINSGLLARPPFVPFLMSLTIFLFGRNILGILLPFFLIRILLNPLIYLTTKTFFSKRLAFIISIIPVLIPKLQTYSFGAPETDVFAAFFYVLALYFYFMNKRKPSNILSVFTGISLGLGALSKTTGLPISMGFILAIFLENMFKSKRNTITKSILNTIIFFLLTVTPYFLWNIINYQKIYVISQNDKSINYIFSNLPSLIYTLPLYFGLNFSIGFKPLLVSLIFLFLMVFGLIFELRIKRYVLILPGIITIFALSVFSSCLIAYNIPANYEFITVLGFCMIPLTILLINGSNQLLIIMWNNFFHTNLPSFITTIIILGIMFKVINNYFSSPYTLEYTNTDFYISMETVVKNKDSLPDAIFYEFNGSRIFKDFKPSEDLKKNYLNNRFAPFTPLYKYLLLLLISISLFIFSIDPYLKNNKSNS